MVEELKLAIKIDDATIEQSLLKQFANAQKMADKVVLDFKNVNFDDKQIEAKFKELQKKAGQNPIDFSISGNTLDMLGQIDKRLTEIFSIGKGKSFIDSSSTVADIGKIENKINELDKKYEEAQKKLSSIGSGGISGKDVNLVDNKEFQKLSDNFEKIKGEIDELKQKINTIDIDTEWLNNFTTRLDEELTDTQAKLDNFINDFNSSFGKINTSTSDTLFNEESIRIFEKLLTSIESSLSSIKGVLVDVGDGEELSPLLKTIANIESAIDNLSSSVKGIGLNMNIDFGSDTELEAKAQAKISNALQAYQNLFEHIKMSSAGGSYINNKFFDFDINQFDTPMSKLQAYIKFIKDMREEAKKMFGGKDILKINTDDKYWNRVSAAMGQVKKTFNEMKAASDTNPLENIFGKTDLTEVLNQLSAIVSKLDEISMSTNRFADVFKDGLNVNASVDEIEKLTNRVKELESELAKIKTPTTVATPQESNISSVSTPVIEQQIKSESELNAEIEKRENIIRELQQLQEKLTVHEDFHGNDRYFADQLPTEEEIREADKRIKQLTGTNNIFDVDKLIQGRNEWLSEVKYSLEEYDDLIKANDQKALDEYTTRGLSRIGGAESFFGYEDNNFSIASKFVEEKEKIQNEINDLYVDLDKLDEKMNFDSNNSSVDNTVQSQEKLQSELKETQEQAEKTAQAVKEVASATASTEQTKDAFPKTSENLEQVAKSEQKVQQEAVATDKALDNISFTPNTEGFDDIIAKFGILREQAEQITKIVKTTKQTADGTPDISYKATLRNGSSYYLGENSTPQVLNASETVYDTNAIEKAYQEATKVNNAINETNSLLNSLKIPNGFEGSFSTLESEIKRLNSEFGSGKISATEYANSIKKAFGNYQTPIDNRSKDIWNELTTSLDRYATLQKRIASNNALSTDNEEATKLLEHIHELQRNDILPTEKLTASNEKLQQINQTVTDLKAKLKESTLDSLQGSIDKYQKIYDQRSTYSSDFTPSKQYTDNLSELDTAIKDLVKYKNTLKNVSEVTVEQETELKRLVTACEKASDSFKSLSASEKGATQIGIDKLVQRINKDLDECTNYSKKAKLGLRALRDELESANPRNLKEILSDMINIENAEIRAGRAGRSFFDTLKNSGFHQLAAQMAGMFGFYDVINVGKEAISTIVSLDDALVDLKKTTAMNSTQLEDFYYDANDVAKQMGVTTEEIITQASSWSRLGYSSQEAATTMAKLSSKFASISPGMSTDEAQEGLVSIMKAFDIDPDDVETEIMDKVNVLGNKFAEENQDVIEGLKRSAAAMSAMGQSFTDTAALFTGGMEILQDSESMGTALRTLSMRVRGYDEETNQLSDDLANVTGEVADLTKTAQDSQGVSLFTDATQEHYRSMVKYLGDIADRWDQISEKNQTELLQKLFGKNRANESVCPYVQKCA